MNKVFCDHCNAEITNKNIATPENLCSKIERNNVQVAVRINHNDIAQYGDFCKYCIFDVIYTLDDRPKIANDKCNDN